MNAKYNNNSCGDCLLDQSCHMKMRRYEYGAEFNAQSRLSSAVPSGVANTNRRQPSL
jgi:hypothetical protein